MGEANRRGPRSARVQQAQELRRQELAAREEKRKQAQIEIAQLQADHDARVAELKTSAPAEGGALAAMSSVRARSAGSRSLLAVAAILAASSYR